MVTLQTKAPNAYPDPNLVPVVSIDGAAADVVAEQTRFEQDTAHNAKQLRSAQEAPSTQIRRQIKNIMPGWLRTKLLEQPETTSVEDLCIFARKQFTIHNLCKTDDSPMDAFREIGPTVTDTLVRALTKLSSTQEAMDNRLNEMSKKLEGRITALINKVENVRKLHTQNVSENQSSQNQRGPSGYNRGQNSNQRGYHGGYRDRYQGSNNRGYRGCSNYQRYRGNFNYLPRYPQPQNFITDMNFNPPPKSNRSIISEPSAKSTVFSKFYSTASELSSFYT